MPQNAINVLIATNQFMKKFFEWDEQKTFRGSAKSLAILTQFRNGTLNHTSLVAKW